MPKKKLRIGIIGTGVGIRTYLPGFRSVEGADVVGISGRTHERAQGIAHDHHIPVAYKSYLDLCSDNSLDLICVASPNEFHLQHYTAAVQSGKHVIVEKPVADSSNELQRIFDVPARETQVVIVNHQLRFNPHFTRLERIVRNGILGRPYHIRIHQQGPGFFEKSVPYSWAFDFSRGGGVRLAMGSHLVDLARVLLQDPPVSTVFGAMDIAIPKRKDHSGVERDVTACSAFSSLVRMGSVTAMLSASAVAASENRFDVDILGTDGEAHFELSSKLRVNARDDRYTYVTPISLTTEEPSNRYSIFRDSFSYLADAVVKALLHGQTGALDPAARIPDTAATSLILDAIAESARRGKAVLVGPDDRTNVPGG